MEHKFLNEVVASLKELASETDKVKQSEFFKHYLDIMSKFWRYSYHSQLLTMSQMPQATRIAGFLKWREMGRWVRKGSRAIRILAPRISKVVSIDPQSGETIEEDEVIGLFPVYTVLSYSRGFLRWRSRRRRISWHIWLCFSLFCVFEPS